MTDSDDERQAALHWTTADVATVAAFTTTIIESANAANEPQEGLVVWPYDAQGNQIIQVTQPQSNSGSSSGVDQGGGLGDDPGDPGPGGGDEGDSTDGPSATGDAPGMDGY